MQDINQTIKELMKKWKGHITFSSHKIDCAEAEKLQEKMAGLQNVPWAEFQTYLDRLEHITEKRETSFNNQIVLSGRSIFARILVGDMTYTGTINYGAVGTDDTAVSDGQTQLVAEVKRKGIATLVRTDDSITFRFFFSKADVSGTLEEFGTFIDGTSAADSGQMFNRALTGGWVKSALEALTVTVQFDLNPA